MSGKIRVSRTATVMVTLILIVIMAFPTTAFAAGTKQEGKPGEQVRQRGTVSAVDLAAGTLSVEVEQGRDYTLSVNERTRFRGMLQDLADVQPGMKVAFAARKVDGDTFVALGIFASIPRERMRGKILEVDPAGGWFTLQTGEGQTITIQTGEKTRFASKDGTVQGLENLEAGMLAGVVAIKQADGSLLALGVLAARPRPRLDVRMRGKVLSVGEMTFTIQNGKGEQVTFTVTEQTLFKSLHGQVNSLKNLKPDMVVGVGASAQEGGSLLAGVVIVVERK